MASLFGFGQSAEVELELDDAEKRRVIQIRTFGDDPTQQKQKILYLYYDGETISGKVCIRLKKPGQKLEHQGIRIDFIGHIEVYYDRGNHNEFCSLTRQLAQPGELMQNTDFRFDFSQVDKPFESYTGANVKLRYFLRVIISRRLSDIVREFDILVHALSSYPDGGSSIRMEVGIEDCLHIEFEYNKSRYHLKDVIVGKIYFLLVRIKIKHMEIAIIKRETVGPGPNMYNDSETIAKYEIMDGAPVKSESIPIRLFLAGYELTPTMKEINKKFSVRYYLNLVLVDDEDRRYFKQQEIILWRRADRLPRRPMHQHAMASYEGTSSISQRQHHYQQQQQPQFQQKTVVASSSASSFNNNNEEQEDVLAEDDDSGESEFPRRIDFGTPEGGEEEERDHDDPQQQQQRQEQFSRGGRPSREAYDDPMPPAEPTPPKAEVKSYES